MVLTRNVHHFVIAVSDASSRVGYVGVLEVTKKTRSNMFFPLAGSLTSCFIFGISKGPLKSPKTM